MKNQIKWGVIGSGGIARRRTIPEGIVPAENAKLVTVFDINPEVNHAVAKEFNVTAVEDIESLLKSDIEAVYIASPANMHLNHVIASAKARKHVFCEKPLGMSVLEAEIMIKACKKRMCY